GVLVRATPGGRRGFELRSLWGRDAHLARPQLEHGAAAPLQRVRVRSDVRRRYSLGPRGHDGEPAHEPRDGLHVHGRELWGWLAALPAQRDHGDRVEEYPDLPRSVPELRELRAEHLDVERQPRDGRKLRRHEPASGWHLLRHL